MGRLNGSGINDVRVAPHFMLREFQCRCCCSVIVTLGLLEALERLRALRGSPLVVTSGYRCKAHNLRVGGVANSLHCFGRAADISVAREEQEEFCTLARKAGFREIVAGGGKNYVHVGVK